MILLAREFKKISLLSTQRREMRTIIEMVAPNHSRYNKIKNNKQISLSIIFPPYQYQIN